VEGFIKAVLLLIAGSVITLCAQIFLKRKDRTEKKNTLIREKLEQAYELSIESQRWLSEEISGHSKNSHPFDKMKMLIALYAPELSSAEQRIEELEYQYFKTRERVSNERFSGRLSLGESEEIIDKETMNLINCLYELRQQIKELVRKLM
jgi:hypothetical protein